MRLQDGRYECVICRTELDVPIIGEPRTSIHIPRDDPGVRVLEYDGVEIHRCALMSSWLPQMTRGDGDEEWSRLLEQTFLGAPELAQIEHALADIERALADEATERGLAMAESHRRAARMHETAADLLERMPVTRP